MVLKPETPPLADLGPWGSSLANLQPGSLPLLALLLSLLFTKSRPQAARLAPLRVAEACRALSCAMPLSSTLGSNEQHSHTRQKIQLSCQISDSCPHIPEVLPPAPSSHRPLQPSVETLPRQGKAGPHPEKIGKVSHSPGGVDADIQAGRTPGGEASHVIEQACFLIPCLITE